MEYEWLCPIVVVVLVGFWYNESFRVENLWAPGRELWQVLLFLVCTFWYQFPQGCLVGFIPLESHWVLTSQSYFCFDRAFPEAKRSALLGIFTLAAYHSLELHRHRIHSQQQCHGSILCIPSLSWDRFTFTNQGNSILTICTYFKDSKRLKIQIWKRKTLWKWMDKSSYYLAFCFLEQWN